MNTSDATGSRAFQPFSPLHRRVRWLLLALSLTSIVVVCLLTFRSPHNRLSDFAGYYTASKLVATGDSVASMYDDQWFIGRMGQFGIIDQKMVFYVNPPAASFVMIPLTGFDPAMAKVVWIGINLGLLLLLLNIAKDLLLFTANSGLAEIFLALLVCSVPFLRNIQRGQIYLFMLLLIVLMWKGYHSQKPWLTGVSLALLLLLKYFGWMFVPLLFLEKRWKELAWTGVACVVGLGISISILGVDTYEHHVERLLTSLRGFDIAGTGLPSLPALFGGLFITHPLWNTSPVTNFPLLAIICIIVSLVLLLGVTYRAHLSVAREHQSHGFLAVVVLSVLFTPLAADHHYIQLALPLFFVATWLLRTGFVRGYLLMFGISCYLILGWIPNFPIEAYSGWFKLLAFRRVYGALILWFLLISTSVRISARTTTEKISRTVGGS